MTRRTLVFSTLEPWSESDRELWRRAGAGLGREEELLFFSTCADPGLGFPHYLRIPDALRWTIDPAVLASGPTSLVRAIADKDRIWDAFHETRSCERALRWLTFWQLAVGAVRPSSVYLWNGNDVIGAALAEVAGAASIPTYFVERGPLARTYARDARGINAASEFVASYDGLAIPEDRDFVDRFQRAYLSSGTSNWEQPDEVSEREAFLRRHRVPSDRRILFLPCQVDRDTNTKVFSPLVRSTLEAVQEVARCLPALQPPPVLLVKVHPRQRVDIRQIHEAAGEHGVVVEAAHVFDCIRYCDAVVSINSSAAVEAALMGKPILLLGQSILSPSIAVETLRSLDDLGPALGRLLSRSDRPVLDYVYFTRLLRGYLRSPHQEYIEMGVQDAVELLDGARLEEQPRDVVPVELALAALEELLQRGAERRDRPARIGARTGRFVAEALRSLRRVARAPSSG